LIWIFGENSVWLALNKKFISDEDMKDYIEYAMLTSPEQLSLQLSISTEARQQWEKMNKLHSQFITLFASEETRPDMNHIGFKIYENASRKFAELREEYEKVKNATEAFRPEPFIMWIYGEPGVGKTFLRDTLASYFYVVHKQHDPTIPDIMETGLTYVRNPADPYVSNYRKHFCFSNDDVGNNRNPNNPEFAEIMGMASTNQMRLPMAELKEKGMLFASKLILLLANSRDVNSNNLILFEEAFNRRRHVVIEMLRPNKDKPGFKTSKKDHGKVRYVIRDPQNSETILHTIPEGEGYCSSEEGIRLLCSFFRNVYIDHVKEQEEFVREKEKTFQKAKLGKTIFDDEEGDVYTDAPKDEIEMQEMTAQSYAVLFKMSLAAEKDPEVAKAFDGYVKNPNYCTRERIWLALAKTGGISREMFDRFTAYVSEKKQVTEKVTKSQLDSVKQWLAPVLTKAQDYVKPIGVVLGLCSAIGAGYGMYQMLFKKDEEVPKVNQQIYDRGPIFRERPLVQSLDILYGKRVDQCFDVKFEKREIPFCHVKMAKVLKDFVKDSDTDAFEYYHLYDALFKRITKRLPGVETEEVSLPILKPLVNIQMYDKGPIFKERPLIQALEVTHGKALSECFDISFETEQIPFMFQQMAGVLTKYASDSSYDAYEYYTLYEAIIKKIRKPINGVRTVRCKLPVLTPKVNIQAFVDIDPRLMFNEKPEVQSACDEIPLLCKNLYVFSYTTSSGRFLRLHGVNLKYNCFLLPWHFFSHYEEGNVVEVKRQGAQGGELLRQCVIPFDAIHRVGDSDWAVVKIDSFNHGKSILQHFATKEDLRQTRVFEGALISYDPYQREHLYISQLGKVYSYDTPIDVVNDDGETVYHRNAYKYKLQTVNGDCGSLLVATDNRMRRKIFGLHFGYSQHLKEAYASIVPQEELIKAVMELVPAVERFEVQDPKIVVTDIQCQANFEKDGLIALETFGTVTDAPMQPKKHKDLFRSPLYGKIYEPEKDLSILSNRDTRMDPELRGGLEIATRNVLGFAPTTTSWPVKHLNMAKSILQSEFQKFDAPTKIEIKDLNWAINGELINGVRVDHCEALNLLTSAGYGLPGKKKKYFKQNVDLTWAIDNPKLQQMIDEQWSSWEEGNAIPTIWTHALKSETLKLEKVRLGKTRTFCVAQAAFLLNFRRLFGSFISAMRNSKIKSFSCLGMDVYSSDWTFLFRALREKGARGLDMDFKNYDRVAITWQLVKAVVEEINAYYNDGPVYARMRLQAAHDLIFSYGLCDGVLTRKYQGNPSGNPMTTELNNAINLLMLVMVVSILKERHRIQETLPSIMKKIAAKFFGDDCIISVDASLEVWLKPAEMQEVYESIGITVTPASKNEDTLGFKPLDQLTFLKCNFVPSGIPQYPWSAGLDKTSIRSLTQFYRSNGRDATMEEAIEENLKLSCEYAYYWGRDFFNEHKQKINGYLQENGIKDFGYIDLEYDDFDSIYKLKLGL